MCNYQYENWLSEDTDKAVITSNGRAILWADGDLQYADMKSFIVYKLYVPELRARLKLQDQSNMQQ